MELMPFDWFLAAVLVAGMPLWAMRKFRRLRQSVLAGRPGARIEAYRNVIVVQWSLTAFLAAHWLLRERSFVEMRFELPATARLLGAMLVATAGIVLLVLQLRTVRADPDTAREAYDQLGDLRSLLPHTPLEVRWFTFVAITAGVCEEVLYRGYLPWLLETVMPTPAAFGVAALVFGVGHLYQGIGGVVKTGLLGALMALMTWLSGSLLPAILLHGAIDLLNGRLAYHVLSTVGPTGTITDERDGPDEETRS